MTKITFFKNEKQFFHKLIVSGHTGFGLRGSDVLCSAISSIVQAGALGITNVLHLNAKIKRDDENGYFEVELPKNCEQKTLEQSQIIFLTMLEALTDLESGYAKFMKLEVK